MELNTEQQTSLEIKVSLMKAWPSLRSDVISTDLADEGKGLAAHPLGTVAEPDCELIDEVQAQVISTTRVQLLEDLYDLRTCGKA